MPRISPKPIDMPKLMAYFISGLNAVRSISTMISSSNVISTSMFSNFLSICMCFMNASSPTVNISISMIMLIILDVYRIMFEYSSGWLTMSSLPIVAIPASSSPRSANIIISVVSDMRRFPGNMSLMRFSRLEIRVIHLISPFMSLISKNTIMSVMIDSVILGKYVMSSENIGSMMDFNSSSADDIFNHLVL